MEIIRGARADLEVLYASALDEDAMRQQKQRRMQQLSSDLQAKLAETGLDSPGWLGAELNNARLASIGLYELDLSRFRDLYEECGRELACFYERASSLRLSPP